MKIVEKRTQIKGKGCSEQQEGRGAAPPAAGRAAERVAHQHSCIMHHKSVKHRRVASQPFA